ncbi:putative ABC transporter permease subunit [Alkaliphilus serpentinus]|uniref:ABC-2 type transport system permease protein n=1 Tax=Alkaliphilus serpentinus TaxID=1482731 RepID=A0A833HMU2_9FIRM|nr:hypothetical protein [Alkaliphilus serpentinus]KAB3528827.1 hypothetical protein F8153_10910 [Alkaliphilus serpentinus]
MNKFIALTKIQIKDFFSKYTQHLNVKNKFLGILTMLLPALLILPAIQLALTLYDSFSMIGYPELTITYIYIANVMLMLFAGIPFIISIFFYSKDLRLIATLPVKEDTIVFSKLASVYIYLLAIGCFFLGTSVVIYGTIDGVKVLSLILGIMALLISPLLPMIISTLIVLPFMSLIGRGRKRNMLVIVGNLVLIAIVIGVQLLMTRIQMQPDAINNLLSQEDGLLRLIGHKFPPSIWLTKMIQGSLLDGGLFILLNLAFIVVLKLFAKKLYSAALLKFNQEGSALIEKGKIYYKSRSIGIQIIKRHIAIITSNPTFLLNTVLTMFIPILMFVLTSLTGELSGDLFNSEALEPYIIYIYTIVVSTPAIMGSLSATAITREGKAFWETKVLPISARDNIKYRIYTTLIINFTGSIILGVAAAYYLPVNFTMILLAAAFCIATTLFFSTIDIAINIQRPLLNWSSPTAAVKNNLNIMLSLLLRVITGGIGFLLYKMMSSLGANTIIGVLSAFFIILYIVAIYIVYGIYERKFVDIAP